MGHGLIINILYENVIIILPALLTYVFRVLGLIVILIAVQAIKDKQKKKNGRAANQAPRKAQRGVQQELQAGKLASKVGKNKAAVCG